MKKLLYTSLLINIALFVSLLYSEYRATTYEFAFENSRATLESYFRTVGNGVNTDYLCKVKYD